MKKKSITTEMKRRYVGWKILAVWLGFDPRDFLGVMLFLVLASNALGSINATPVQTATVNTGTSSTVTSQTLTLSSTPEAGNTLIAAIGCNTGGMKIVQTNVSWFQVPIILNTASATPGTTLFVGRVFASAGTTLTFSHASGTSTVVFAAVVSEFSSTLPLLFDKSSSAIGTSVSPASGATSTTVVPNELWVGALSRTGAWATSGQTLFSAPTNGFSIVSQDNTRINSGDRAVALLVQVVSSTGTPNAGATIVSAAWAATVATFQEAGAGGISRSRVQTNQ